jgi:hypothetical protein
MPEPARATLICMEGQIFTVDRILDGVAVLIDNAGIAHEIDAGRLPAGVEEGAVLRSGDGGFHVDQGETRQRRNRIRSKLQALRDR